MYSYVHCMVTDRFTGVFFPQLLHLLLLLLLLLLALLLLLSHIDGVGAVYLCEFDLVNSEDQIVII